MYEYIHSSKFPYFNPPHIGGGGGDGEIEPETSNLVKNCLTMISLV